MTESTNLLSLAQPLRVAVQTRHGPLIVPLWFVFQNGCIWCASQEDSVVVRALQADPRCAFDLSTNDMPYRGIRGRGSVRCIPESGGQVLKQLIDRYQVNRDSRLARWLLSRSDTEVAIEITPNWQTEWDYSERMA
jgi:Pyridoxamine 5'-phosphate oxidase